MITRLGLKMGLFVVCARWMYAEVELMAPGALPLIDRALQQVAIPTHDTWDEHYVAAKDFIDEWPEHKEHYLSLIGFGERKDNDTAQRATPRDSEAWKVNSAEIKQLLHTVGEPLSAVQLQLAAR